MNEKLLAVLTASCTIAALFLGHQRGYAAAYDEFASEYGPTLERCIVVSERALQPYQKAIAVQVEWIKKREDALHQKDPPQTIAQALGLCTLVNGPTTNCPLGREVIP